MYPSTNLRILHLLAGFTSRIRRLTSTPLEEGLSLNNPLLGTLLSAPFAFPFREPCKLRHTLILLLALEHSIFLTRRKAKLLLFVVARSMSQIYF